MRARTLIGAFAGAVAIAATVFVLRRSSPLPEHGPSVVIVVHHEAPAAELQSSVADPIEEAVAKLDRMERVRTESGGGRVRVTCRFSKGTVADDAAERTQAAIQGTLKKIPPEVSPPLVHRAPSSRVLFFAYDKPLSELETIPGVAEVQLCGERKERVQVVFDFNQGKARSVDIADVFAAFTVPGGKTRDVDLEAIATTRLGANGVLLRDVATIEKRLEEPACVGVLADRPAHLVGRIRLQTMTDQQTMKAIIAVGGELRKASAVFFDPASSVRIAIGLPAAKEQRRATAEKVAAALREKKAQLAGVFGALDESEAEALAVVTPGATQADVDAIRAAVRAVPNVVDRGLLYSPHEVPARLAVIADDEASAAEAKKIVEASGRRFLVRDLPAPEPLVDVKVDRARTVDAGLSMGDVARTARLILNGVDMPHFHLATLPSGPEGIEVANLHGHPLAMFLKVTRTPDTILVRVDRKRAFERVWEIEDTKVRDEIAKALAGKPLRVELLPAP